MQKALCMLLVLFLVASSTLVEITVRGETQIVVPDSYSTIQAAVDHASVGATIVVRAGSYNGSVTINKALTLTGENGAAIVDWFANGRAAIVISANYVTVTGITIHNPKTTTSWNPQRGIHLLAANNCTITNNHISDCSYGEAIWLYQAQNNTITGNTVENSDSGIRLGLSKHNTFSNNVVSGNDKGISLYEDSGFNTFNDNQLLNNRVGVKLESASDNTFVSNKISGSIYGVQISEQFLSNVHIQRNMFYHNSFVSNTKNVESYWKTFGAIYLDDGAEGNYYSSYKGEDLDCDGIGDTPYFIATSGADVTDRYPLMKPWTGNNLPPAIVFLSPTQNMTYTSSEVALNFTVSRTTSELKYSLDGQENTTVTGNVTLADLHNGNHTVAVYATGETGAQAMPLAVNFTVAVPQPIVLPVNPTAEYALLFALAIIFVVAASLLIYRTKYRNRLT